jgi:hypothetical protein
MSEDPIKLLAQMRRNQEQMRNMYLECVMQLGYMHGLLVKHHVALDAADLVVIKKVYETIRRHSNEKNEAEKKRKEK